MLQFSKGIRTLPTDWTDTNKQEAVKKRIKLTMRKGCDALATLHSFARKNFSGDWCKDWHDITADWLDSHVDKRLDQLSTLPFTDGTISRIADEWEEKRTTAKGWLLALQGVKDLELAGAVIKQEQDTLICTNKDELTNKASITEVDDVCREFWRLCQNTRESFLKLELFCDKNGLKEPIANEVMRKDNAQDFLDGWNWGLYHKQPTDKQREAFNQQLIKNQL